MCVCVYRGVLDGLLESYPWRGPLSLDFKPFAIQLQGTVPQLWLLHSPSSFLFLSLWFKFFDIFFHRELRVADQQCEEPPPSLLFLIPSPVFHVRLPGRCSPHPRSSSLRQGLLQLAQLAAVQQRHLLPGGRQTARAASALSADRPSTSLSAAGKENSPL